MRNAFLSRISQGRWVEKILFVATKADHLHHTQQGQLTAITEALLRDAKDRADFARATTAAMSIAALRTTVEESVDHRDGPLNVVRGRLLNNGKQAAFYPEKLPSDQAHLLGSAQAGVAVWLDDDYAVMRFAPAPLKLKPRDGPPHIRLDKGHAIPDRRSLMTDAPRGPILIDLESQKAAQSAAAPAVPEAIPQQTAMHQVAALAARKPSQLYSSHLKTRIFRHLKTAT